MRTLWLILLVPALGFAGAGTNGGGGSASLPAISYDLTFGTFTVGGSSFDYLATDAPSSLILDSGDTAVQAIGTVTGLDSRVYSGIAELILSPANNIVFSTGPSGEISGVSDPSQIINEAISLGLIDSGPESSSASDGAFSIGTVTSTENVPVPGGDFEVETIVQPYGINIEEADFNGAVAPAAVPEPSNWAATLALLCAMATAAVRRGRSCYRGRPS